MYRLSSCALARTAIVVTAIGLLSSINSTATAATVTDPTNDFIPSFTGTAAADLDVIAASVTFDGSNFDLSVTLSGAVDTTSSALYVFGVNRGQGTARFGDIATGVLFDAVITASAAGVGTITTFLPTPVSNTLAAGSVTINSNIVDIIAPLSLLPGLGFLPADYAFNVWPRDTLVVGNGAISDFAPDNSTFTTAVPEPSTWAMMLLGFAGIGFMTYRRRRTATLAV